MRPPNFTGILKRFDTSVIDPLTVRRHLGYTLDDRTGQRIDGGHAAAVPLVAPYAFMSVEGDQRRELAAEGDRLRDARWLWSGETFTPGSDGDAPGGIAGGDIIVRGDGTEYDVRRRQDDQAVTEFRGYYLERRTT